MNKEIKTIEEAQKQVLMIINAIYCNGDEDEQAEKHILHGLAILLTGGDPSLCCNYKDYDYAGYIASMSDYTNMIMVESALQADLWDDLENLFDRFGEDVLELIDEYGYAYGLEYYINMYS